MARDLASSGLAEAEYVARFDRALWNQKRTSLLLLIPVFAGATLLLERARRARRVRPYYVEHLVHAIHFFAFWLGYLFALAGALTLLLATLRALPVAGARGASVGETGLTLLLTAGLGLWLYGSQRRFFERAPLGAALAATCSLGVFWWLFYDWYQTLSVLGTFMVWGP